MRTVKFSSLYTVVIGAAISCLPYSIYVLIFQAKLTFISAVLLWVLTTVVIVEDWWVTTDIFEDWPTDSIFVIGASFLYLAGLLSLPAVLIGATHDQLGALRLYVWVFITLSGFDILFCVAYALCLPEKKTRYAFWLFIVMDLVVAALYGFWLGFIGNSDGTLQRKVIWLCALYGAELLFEAVVESLSRGRFGESATVSQ
jgi:hypothetical protein